MKYLITFACCLLVSGVFAQPGVSEMQQATQDLTASFFSAFDCCMVLAGIFGLTAAVKIHHNWQMGKREITADVAEWFFAAIFMVLSGVFLRALFGI